MAVSLERRYRLMDKIRNLKDDQLFEELEQKLENENQAFMDSVKPLRAFVSIEQMKKEQNYQPIDKETFFKKVDELNIQEPLEDLLEMLD